MKFLTIFVIFSVVVTLGNSAPTFLEWFGFDVDQATTELPDDEELTVTIEPNLDDNSSPTDIPYETTQTSIEESSETPGTESTTDDSGSGDASTTTEISLPESIIGDSGDSDNDNKEIEAPQDNNEARKEEQDGNINIENPDNENKENADDKDRSVESEIQDPWKEFEEQLNEEYGQYDIDEDDSKEGDDDNTNNDKQNYKNQGDEDENAKEALIKQYIRENIETVCSHDECVDQCRLQRHYGGYCKYESKCICF